MDQNQFRNLYLEEIDLYKQQIESLKNGNRQSEEKNAALIGRIRDLENLIEKAAVANKDLNMAFEHMVLENRRLQQLSGQTNTETRAIQSSENLGLHRVNDFNMQVEESRETNPNLETQYFDLARHSVSWLSEKERMSQRIKFLERECDRYNRDNTTLGKQVRHLLRSLEEERGMIIRRQRDIESLTCAADVIDEHLVTFESIEQLQQQNQKLLSLVKDLSAKQEERETVLENDEIKRLTLDIDDLRSKLEKAESDRENVLTALNTLYKERDLFKILLSKTRDIEHMTPEIFQRMVTVAVSSGPAIADVAESSFEKDVQINHLKDTISRLEQQIVELKNELKEIRLKHEEEIRVKCELLEKAHMKILSESQRADTLKDRVQVLEGNITALTLEFDETRTKYQKASFEVEQKQQSIDGLENTLKALNIESEDFKLKYHKASFEVEQKQQIIDKFESSLKESNTELEDVRFKYRQLSLEVEQKQQSIERLENGLRNSDTELETVKLKLNDLKRQLLRLESKLARSRKDFSSMQYLRNSERDQRLKLLKKLNSKPRSKGAKKSEIHSTRESSVESSPIKAKPNVIRVAPVANSPVRSQSKAMPATQVMTTPVAVPPVRNPTFRATTATQVRTTPAAVPPIRAPTFREATATHVRTTPVAVPPVRVPTFREATATRVRTAPVTVSPVRALSKAIPASQNMTTPVANLSIRAPIYRAATATQFRTTPVPPFKSAPSIQITTTPDAVSLPVKAPQFRTIAAAQVKTSPAAISPIRSSPLKKASVEASQVVAASVEVSQLGDVPVAVHTVEALPVECAVAEATPIEITPVVATPVRGTSAEVSMIEVFPAETTLVEVASVGATLDEVAPFDVAPFDVAPVEATPVEATPVESAPVESAPVEATPVEATPVESAPVESAPVEATSVEATSVEVASIEITPVEVAPNEAASVEDTPVEVAPVEVTPVETALLDDTPFDATQVEAPLIDAAAAASVETTVEPKSTETTSDEGNTVEMDMLSTEVKSPLPPSSPPTIPLQQTEKRLTLKRRNLE